MSNLSQQLDTNRPSTTGDRPPSISPYWICTGLLAVWIFTFLTVFAGGIALDTVGVRIWIWPLVFNFAAILFVYFMCPDPTGKALEQVKALFAKDDAILSRLNCGTDEKPDMHHKETVV